MFPAGSALKLVPLIVTLAPAAAALGLNPVITQLVLSARAVRKVSIEKKTARPASSLKQPLRRGALLRKDVFCPPFIPTHGAKRQNAVNTRFNSPSRRDE